MMEKPLFRTQTLSKPQAWLVYGLTLVIMGTGLVWAQQRVDFNSLGLSQTQRTNIDHYEAEWRKTYTRLQPQIERDRTELRRLINDPNANEGQVMAVQTRLQNNEDKLRNEATRIFMKKKGQLNPEQKKHLQKMMGH